MTPIADLRLAILAGKGGVGRTTVAAALARAMAAQGRRVLIAQTEAADRLAKLFGRAEPVGADIVTLAPGIDAVNMTPKSALHEYGLMVLRYETVYRALFENRAVRGFLGAIPGLDAYAMLGKVWWHTTETVRGRPRYDLVILDGPASGHATLMLRLPQAVLAAMPRGPLARDAQAAHDLITDPARAAMVIVTLPEELPVRETVELAHTARETLKIPLGPVVVNASPHGRPVDASHGRGHRSPAAADRRPRPGRHADHGSAPPGAPPDGRRYARATQGESGTADGAVATCAHSRPRA